MEENATKSSESAAGTRDLANPPNKRLKEEFGEGKRNFRALHCMRKSSRSVALDCR